MPLTWETGAGIALGAMNAAGNAFGIGQKRQLKQQEKLNQQQVKAQMQLADYQRQMQMQMWKDTNYSAQVEELKKAGLNPAILYGKGGGGGMSVGAGINTGVNGGQAEAPSAMMKGFEGMSMIPAQIELMKAQKENIQADTANKLGVDAELKGAQAGEAQSRIELNKIQSEINRLDLELKGKSLEDQLYIIEQTAHKMTGERDKAWAEGNVAQATQEAQIKLINQELTNKAIEAAAMQKGIDLDNARITEITNNIQQKWQELNIKEASTRWEHQDRVKSIEEYTANALKVAGIMAVGNLVGDIAKIATNRLPTKGGTKEFSAEHYLEKYKIPNFKKK